MKNLSTRCSVSTGNGHLREDSSANTFLRRSYLCLISFEIHFETCLFLQGVRCDDGEECVPFLPLCPPEINPCPWMGACLGMLSFYKSVFNSFGNINHNVVNAELRSFWNFKT